MRFLRTYGRVLGLLRGEWRVATFLAIANIAIGASGFLDPVLFGRVIDILGRSSRMASTELRSQGGALLAVWATFGLASVGAGMVVAVLADRLAHRARMRELNSFFAHALGLPPSFHAASHSGGLMRVLHAGSDCLFSLWLGFFREHLVTFVSMLVLLPLTMFLNWRLSLALIALIALFVSATALVIQGTQTRQERVEQFHKELASTAQDAIANVVVVQSFRRLAAERRSFAALGQLLVSQQMPVLNWWAVVNVLTRSASTLTVLAVASFGTLLHIRGQATVGEIVSFMGFATMLIGRLESMVWFVAKLFSATATLDEFFAVTDTRSTVHEDANATELTPGAGEIAFEDVSFAYPGGPDILSGLTFTARQGTVTALVGPTGAGKSTAMNLLQRMWDPTSGRVVFDGQDIRGVTLDSLRALVGVVFQDSMLFSRSIRENLLVGRADATQEEVEQACRLAEAHDFIMRQPQGYDTMVGERGSTLSGGQKQRLAIARALLKNPPILVLDEATSALDAATEAKVTKALKVLMAGRTTFVIAHRLSTVRDADEILVFDSGRIAERGSFDDLLAQGGLFANLVASQLTPSANTNVVRLEDHRAA